MSDTVSAPVMRRGGPARRRWKFFEGWLDHKSKQAKHYQVLWCVLVERTIHIFRSKEEKNENTVIGSLTIDQNTRFKVTSADDRNGYKFDLTTKNGMRSNRFRSKKKVEMEMWRGYIHGLSKGVVPDDLDLLYDQVQQIRDDIEYYRQSDDYGLYDNRRPVSEAPSGDSGIVDAKSQVTGISGGTASTISGPGGGPVMRHKFTNNPAMDDRVPGWFFTNCSRDRAEKILVNAGSLGNTMMRESSSQKAQGSYVISKLSKMKGKPPMVEHFEVERVDRGYRIKVENKHDPMSNLTEVMNYFMFTAGVETTVPMKSNRLSAFGLSDDEEVDPYNLKKIEREIPRSSMELPEPLPDYEEPVSKPRTFTPGILKKETEKFYFRTDDKSASRPSASRTSMDKLSSTVRERSNRPSAYRRVDRSSSSNSGPEPLRQSVPRSPSPPEGDQEFDAPAPGREAIYYNAEDEVSQLRKDVSSTELRSSLGMPTEPAPPTPHIPQSQGYYNDRERDRDLATPKEACPSPPDLPLTLPPKLPPRNQPEKFASVIKKKVQIDDTVSEFGSSRQYRTKSVPDIGTQIGGHMFGTTGETIDLDKPVDRSQEPPASVIPQSALAAALKEVKLRPTSTATPSPGPTSKGLRSSISPPVTSPMESKPKTPSSVTKVPSGGNISYVDDKVPSPQQMGLRPTPKKEANRQQSNTPSESDSPVDDSHPGSVRSILGRFEQMPSDKQSPSTAPKPKRGTNAQGLNTPSSKTNISSHMKNNRHSFGGISHSATTPFNSRSNPNISTNNSSNSAFAIWPDSSSRNLSGAQLIEDEFYENYPDTIATINTSDEEEAEDDMYQDAISPSAKTAFDSSFRRKLEQQLSSGSLPVNKPNVRRSSSGVPGVGDDELYEELPELNSDEDI